MRSVAYALIGLCLPPLADIGAEPQALTGRFEGTGRACYGTLAIRAKTITWQTTFSHCESTPFELIAENQQEGKTRLTYRLKAPAPNCRYAILTLIHAGSLPESGWEATGYGSLQSYDADKSSGYKAKTEDMMSCTLIRTPEK